MSSDDPASCQINFLLCIPSIVSAAEPGGGEEKKKKTGLVGCSRHATKDGNAREEGKNTARWIYIGVYHNCLSQILLYLLLPVEIAALITSFMLKIIKMQIDHGGYSVCVSISS